MAQGRLMVRWRHEVGRLLAWLVALSAAPLAAQSTAWTDGRVAGPFVCRADFPLRPLEAVLASLAQLQGDLVSALAVPPARERIDVYLFESERSYRQFLARHFPSVPYRRALYIKNGGPGAVMAFWSRDFEVDLRHECTHALLHASLAMVPLWLDEGLAEYFELPPDQRAYDNPYGSQVRWNARFGLVPKLAGLEAKGNIAQMGQGEYRGAWAWVHFCLHGPPEARQILLAYLGDLAHNTPPGLFSDRLGLGVPDADSRFSQHFRSWRR